MNREAIVQNLRGIGEALRSGDQVECGCGNLIMFCFKKLEQHWFNIEFKAGQPQYPKVDEIEYFLSHIKEW